MKVIANPRAGHGKGTGHIDRLRGLVRDRGLDCSVVLTERVGHATELARTAAAEGDARVIVAGGDGTIAEAVNGLVGTSTELGVISMGTGNDVARSLGLPRGDLAAALDIATGPTTRVIDVGRERERCFVSVLGLVFPAEVARTANTMTWLSGSPAFFVAVYRALRHLRAVPLAFEIDDRRFERRCVAVLIQNTPYTGGGLRMAPDARMDDGEFDVVIVDDIRRLDLMIHFPRAYWGGHLRHPQFTVQRARRITIRCDVPLPKMFDGDLYGSTPLEAEVVPKGLTVAVPAASVTT